MDKFPTSEPAASIRSQSSLRDQQPAVTPVVIRDELEFDDDDDDDEFLDFSEGECGPLALFLPWIFVVFCAFIPL